MRERGTSSRGEQAAVMAAATAIACCVLLLVVGAREKVSGRPTDVVLVVIPLREDLKMRENIDIYEGAVEAFREQASVTVVAVDVKDVEEGRVERILGRSGISISSVRLRVGPPDSDDAITLWRDCSNPVCKRLAQVPLFLPSVTGTNARKVLEANAFYGAEGNDDLARRVVTQWPGQAQVVVCSDPTNREYAEDLRDRLLYEFRVDGEHAEADAGPPDHACDRFDRNAHRRLAPAEIRSNACTQIFLGTEEWFSRMRSDAIVCDQIVLTESLVKNPVVNRIEDLRPGKPIFGLYPKGAQAGRSWFWRDVTKKVLGQLNDGASGLKANLSEELERATLEKAQFELRRVVEKEAP